MAITTGVSFGASTTNPYINRYLASTDGVFHSFGPDYTQPRKPRSRIKCQWCGTKYKLNPKKDVDCCPKCGGPDVEDEDFEEDSLDWRVLLRKTVWTGEYFRGLNGNQLSGYSRTA